MRSAITRNLLVWVNGMSCIGGCIFSFACDECEEDRVRCDGTKLQRCARPVGGHVPTGPGKSNFWETSFDCATVGATCQLPERSTNAGPLFERACVYPEVACPGTDSTFCLTRSEPDAAALATNGVLVLSCESENDIPRLHDRCVAPESCHAEGQTARCQVGARTCSPAGATRCFDDDLVLECVDAGWHPDRTCNFDAWCIEDPDVEGESHAVCVYLEGQCMAGESRCVDGNLHLCKEGWWSSRVTAAEDCAEDDRGP